MRNPGKKIGVYRQINNGMGYFDLLRAFRISYKTMLNEASPNCLWVFYCLLPGLKLSYRQ